MEAVKDRKHNHYCINCGNNWEDNNVFATCKKCGSANVINHKEEQG